MHPEVACDTPAKRPTPRFRFPRHAKHLDMGDAKLAMDIIFRPSIHLLKLAVARSTLTSLKWVQKSVVVNDDVPSPSSSIEQKKRVRFHKQPVTISRRNFFERRRKNPTSSPMRPCLVIRLHDDVPHNPPEPPVESDDLSIYEECLSDYPGFLADIEVLESHQNSDTLPLKSIRRSEFYETEHGIASFDRTGYANYCLSRWLDKQREEAWTTKKPFFENPALLPWPERTLSPPSNHMRPAACSIPTPCTRVCRPPRSLLRRIWKLIEDELHNAIVVLIVGSCIHICLFLYLLYDIFTRGLIPAED